jgi:hypothetical protein
MIYGILQHWKNFARVKISSSESNQYIMCLMYTYLISSNLI